MEHFLALRLLALRDVLRDRDGIPAPASPEFLRRKIYRWFSEKFHTPLHLVDELPIDDILQHYYEANYEAMEEEDLQRELAVLTETPEAAAARAARKNLDALATWEMERENDADDNLDAAFARAKGNPAAPLPPGTLQTEAARAAPKLLSPQNRGAEVQLPEATKKLEQGLKMTFVTLEELERLEGEDGLGEMEPLTGL